MEAWISINKNHKDNTSASNYTRFGKAIPKVENKIDICKYFGVSKERAEYIVKQLMSDSRVNCKPHKSASDSVRKKAENIEKVEADKKVVEKKKEIDKEVTNEIKPVKKAVKKTTKKVVK